MHKISIFLALFILLTSESSYIIKADSLDFEKSSLNFENGFYLEHSFGKVFANKAKCKNIKKANKLFDFSLSDGVKLITNSNSHLISDRAEFDANSSEISFFSEDVVKYFDKIKNKNLKITSKTVTCHLDTINVMKKLKLDNIYSISFLEDAKITIEDKLNILCKNAIFKKEDSSSKIFLYPDEKNRCFFTLDESSVIATKASLDVNTINLELENPKGQIIDLLKNNTNVLFEAKKLFWHNFENSFVLKEDAKVIDKSIGNILSQEIEIIKVPNKNEVKKIITKGSTSINFFSKTQGTLKTKGIIELDNEKKIISAFSFKNEDHSLLYVDQNVCISARKASLEYDEKENIKNIFLQNSVRFQYKENENILGYGIADKIKYIPNQQKIVLLSEKDSKVLFLKQDNSLKLSAQEVHINPKEKNDIKGVGDVRFTLNLDEKSLIDKIFSKYKFYE